MVSGDEIEALEVPLEQLKLVKEMGRLRDDLVLAMGIPAHLSVSKPRRRNVRLENDMIERRIVVGDALDNTVVVWEKFECDEGCRWTMVQNLPGEHFWRNDKDGDPCNFRGCKPGHFIHKRGETSDRTEAYEWSRNVHQEAKA